jgi:hypothetical protein
VPGPHRSASLDRDRRVASAGETASQQVGGASGTALLSATKGSDRGWRADLANAGGGLGLGIVQVAAIIPGFLPALILALALVAVVVVPLMALVLLVGLVAAPPYGLWRLARRQRSEP